MFSPAAGRQFHCRPTRAKVLGLWEAVLLPTNPGPPRSGVELPPSSDYLARELDQSFVVQPNFDRVAIDNLASENFGRE